MLRVIALNDTRGEETEVGKVRFVVRGTSKGVTSGKAQFRTMSRCV